MRKQEYLERLVEIPVTLVLQNVGFQVECGGGSTVVGDEIPESNKTPYCSSRH